MSKKQEVKIRWISKEPKQIKNSVVRLNSRPDQYNELVYWQTEN